MKYLLIDGNNLAVRSAFANDGLTNQEGVPTGVHYGVFNSLILLKKKFPSHQFLVVWDGKSARRVLEAQEGVQKGLVPSGYKENRDKGDDMPQPLKDFYSQADFLKKGIGQTGIPQIRLKEFEADDIIASYSRKISKNGEEVICVTSDKDYYQLLDDNIKIFDGMKDQMIKKSEWVKSNGIEPEKHVDVGSLSGDTGDNIFGVPGWGEKTAIKAIQQYGSWEGVLKAYHEKYDEVRKEFPDIHGKEFEELKNLRTDKEEEKFKNDEPWKGKYPEISEGMPFTGVALAFEKGDWKPKKKTGVKNELMVLIFEDRIKLAYSLKKMDDDIPDLPEIKQADCNIDNIMQYLEYYDIYTLQDDLYVFEPMNINEEEEDLALMEG
jgi:5'-3' exonuclease